MMGSDAGLSLRHVTGMSYNPLTGQWAFNESLDVNYIAAFAKAQ